MIYFVTTTVLIATVAGFFLWGRGGLRGFGWPQWLLRVLVALPLLVSGTAHFTLTRLFATIVPPAFPHPAMVVLVSGVLELAGGVGLLLPGFTRAAASCVALLMIAVFPANVYAAHRTVGGLPMPGVPLRLVMQVVYVLAVLAAGWGIRRRRVAG